MISQQAMIHGGRGIILMREIGKLTGSKNGNNRLAVSRVTGLGEDRLRKMERRGSLPPFGTYETAEYVEIVLLRATLMGEGWSPQRIDAAFQLIQSGDWIRREMEENEKASAEGRSRFPGGRREIHPAEPGVTPEYVEELRRKETED